MTLKAKVAGLAVAAVVAVTGLGIAPSAHADPVSHIVKVANQQTFDRIERTGDDLGLQIRF